MRQVAGDRQHPVVMVGVHELDIGADAPPHFGDAVDRGAVGARRRRQDAPALAEQLGKARFGAGMLGAGDRVARHQRDAPRQQRRQRLDHRTLGRGDIGDDDAGTEQRAEFPADRGKGARRHCQDDEPGAGDGASQRVVHAVGEAQLFRRRPRRGAGVEHRDMAGQSVGAQRPRQRRADQADADNGDAPEDRRPGHRPAGALRVRKSPSTATIRSISGRVPIDSLTQSGRP